MAPLTKVLFCVFALHWLNLCVSASVRPKTVTLTYKMGSIPIIVTGQKDLVDNLNNLPFIENIKRIPRNWKVYLYGRNPNEKEDWKVSDRRLSRNYKSVEVFFTGGVWTTQMLRSEVTDNMLAGGWQIISTGSYMKKDISYIQETWQKL